MKGTIRQYCATFSVALLMSSGTVANFWSSPIIPQLLKDDSPIGVTITRDEASLITSFLLFGSILGNVILGPCIDFLGRKGTLLLSSVPICFCWVVIIFARSVLVLYIARFVQGIFAAMPSAVCVLYIGEIASAKIRGRLSVMLFVISEISSLLTIILGSYVSYKILGTFGAVLPILFIITIIFMPESPYFYIKINDFERAEKSLNMFRDSKNIDEELSKMKKTVEDDLFEQSSFLDLFRVGRFKQAILLLLGLKTLQQMSGVTAINSYMKIIFEEAKTGIDSDISSIASVSVALPANLLSSYLIDKFGRKLLYYLVTLGMMTSLLIESTYFFLPVSYKENIPFLSWLPVSGIFLFNIFKSFGITLLPNLILGELFPPKVKGHATSFLYVYGSSLASLTAWAFPGFSAKFGFGVSFSIFAAFCFGGFLFVKFFLPETKCKCLADIQTVKNLEDV